MADGARNARMGMLNAIAAGGKIGGDEFQQAQGQIGVQKNQALADAAQRAGATNAPAAFLQRQAGIVSQPADTALAQVGANAQAAANYKNSLASAQHAYLADVPNSEALYAQLAAQKAATVQSTAQNKLLDAIKGLYGEQRSMQNDAISQASQGRTAQNRAEKDFTENIKTGALQGLAGDAKDTFNEAIQRGGSLQGTLKLIGTVQDPGIQADLADRALRYFNPDLWIQTSPNASTYRQTQSILGRGADAEAN